MTGSPAADDTAQVEPAGAAGRLRVIATRGFADYALLDSGHGRKLERFGRFTVDRPEPQAMWRQSIEPGQWLRADATFKSGDVDEDGDGGRWKKNSPIPETWPIQVSASPCSGDLRPFAILACFPNSCRTGRGCSSGWPRFGPAAASGAQPLRLYRRRLPDRRQGRSGGDAC